MGFMHPIIMVVIALGTLGGLASFFFPQIVPGERIQLGDSTSEHVWCERGRRTWLKYLFWHLVGGGAGSFFTFASANDGRDLSVATLTLMSGIHAFGVGSVGLYVVSSFLQSNRKVQAEAEQSHGFADLVKHLTARVDQLESGTIRETRTVAGVETCETGGTDEADAPRPEGRDDDATA